MAVFLSSQSFAAGLSTGIPAWLAAHVGEGDGQIAAVVLQKARAFYGKELTKGAVKNPCYFAMDATRPNATADGTLAPRFYIICEVRQTFRAVTAGHGSGRRLKGIADFANGPRCARNFGNALGSSLTTGGGYLTAETRTSFKGYYHTTPHDIAALSRAFIQFDGAGDTANARARAIGGHPAVLVKNACLWKDASSPYADPQGYVPLGTLVDYSGGRSNGCTSWQPADAKAISAMVQDDPTTLYIYPEAADIAAVAHAVASHQPLSQAGLYWNASCLKEIRAPKYWPDETLGPIIAQFARDHPQAPPMPLPICEGQ